MSELEKPPLDPRVYDLIELSHYKADQRGWDELEPMQVAPVVGPPKFLPAPKLREMLLNRLRVYAGDLFKLEADQYSEYKTKPEYPAWLSKLADRVIARVFNTVEILERAKEPATLAYHALTDDEIRGGLKLFLLEIENGYVWEGASSPIQTEAQQPQMSVPPPPISAPLTRSIAQQIKDLQDESRMTAEAMAESIRLDPRNVFRHLSGDSTPRAKNIAAYEKLFTDKLGRPIRLETSGKRQRR